MHETSQNGRIVMRDEKKPQDQPPENSESNSQRYGGESDETWRGY